MKTEEAFAIAVEALQILQNDSPALGFAAKAQEAMNIITAIGTARSDELQDAEAFDRCDGTVC